VEVQVHRADHELVMQVRDNGNGSLPDDTAPDTPRNTPVSPDEAGGIGLGNTRARLMQLYGPAASLDLRREQGMTVAEVRIPLPAGVA